MYCQDQAGFLKKVCRDCSHLTKTVEQLPPSFGYREMLDSLLATEIDSSKIEKFLDADIHGEGSLNDRVTARMTNEVMAGLGQPSHMKAKDVKQVRHDITSGNPPSAQCEDDHLKMPHNAEKKE